MKKHLIILILILVLAAILRFWGLGLVPSSPDWDEAAFGYNAYSMIHTGHDEFGKFLPVVLESFGDYKPALYAYLSIPPVAIFGLNVFAVRFPSALFGLLTVLAVYFLIKELFKDKNLALLIAFRFAVSPWNIQFSRVAFEANVGVAFNVFACLFLLKGLKKPFFLLPSAVLFGLNLYVYQSEKVFTPLFALALVIIYKSDLLKLSKKYLVGAVFCGIIVSAPMLVYIVSNPLSLARAEGVSIFSEQTQLLSTSIVDLQNAKQAHDVLGEILYNRRFVYVKEVLSNYFSHYNLNWLFITGDLDRHHAPSMGLLYLWDLPFLFIGIYALVFNAYPKKTKWVIFSWFLLGPTPAAVTTGVPHAVRSMNFLPTPQIFIGLGILSFYLFIEKSQLLKKQLDLKRGIYVLVGLLFLFNFCYYIDQYFAQTNYFTALDWQYGFSQIVSEVMPVQHKYRKIVVSDGGNFSQSYIFFLFYTKYNPAAYLSQGGTQTPGGPQRFANFQFRQFNYSTEKSPDTLYIGAPSDFPSSVKPVYEVFYPNSLPAMEAVVKQ